MAGSGASTIQLHAASKLLRCFGGDGQHQGDGNLAHVSILVDPAVVASADDFERTVARLARDARLRAATTASVRVFAGQLQQPGSTSELPAARMASFSPAGERIQFCGHGALAAASVIFDMSDNAWQQLSFESQTQQWLARREHLSGDTVLVYTRPTPVAVPVPGFASDCFGFRPQAAAEVGAEDGYLVLEFPVADCVLRTQPDFAALARATRRAVIATAATDSNSDDSDAACVFRYFAPQYGNPEDAATGSAGVQLAAYWRPRLKLRKFVAQQVSRSGAWLQLECTGNKVELGGRVEYC